MVESVFYSYQHFSIGLNYVCQTTSEDPPNHPYVGLQIYLMIFQLRWAQSKEISRGKMFKSEWLQRRTVHGVGLFLFSCNAFSNISLFTWCKIYIVFSVKYKIKKMGGDIYFITFFFFVQDIGWSSLSCFLLSFSLAFFKIHDLTIILSVCIFTLFISFKEVYILYELSINFKILYFYLYIVLINES